VGAGPATILGTLAKQKVNIQPQETPGPIRRMAQPERAQAIRATGEEPANLKFGLVTPSIRVRLPLVRLSVSAASDPPAADAA